MKRRLLCLAAFAVLAPIPMFAQITGVLTGKVTDQDSKPVIGATIRIVGTTQGGISKAPDGAFTIAGIRAGDYTVRVSSVGYQPSEQKVRISADQTTNVTFKIGDKPIQGTTVVVTDNRMVQPERVGTSTTISTEDLDRSARTSIVGAVALQGGVSTAGVNGFSFRGGRATETNVQVDGVKITDPFSGGFGTTSASLYPTISPLAVQEIQVIPSGFSAEYGEVLSGVVNSVTKSGRNDRYEGTFRYRTNVGALYGSTGTITVKKAGTDIDTTLPSVKAQSSGSDLYEFAFGGPIPGTSFGSDNNRITFFITGKYNPIPYAGASYEVLDFSPEMAAQRNPIARSLGLPELTPTNLGQLPNSEAVVTNIQGKLKFTLSDEIFVELSGEKGALRREIPNWASLYLLDRPTVVDPATGLHVVDHDADQDQASSILERDHQTVNQNTKITRGLLRYFQTLDQSSYFEVTGSYTKNVEEVGRKDESKSYGPFDTYDIYLPADEGTVENESGRFILPTGSEVPNIAIDRYEDASRTLNSGQLNPYYLREYQVRLHNPITGFFEGPENSGASYNPYGLNDLNFPAHGADRNLEFRESETVTFKGAYESNFELGDVKTRLKSGFEANLYTLRRHNNSLPWDQKPFFDVYGFSSTYFVDDPGLNDFFAEPFNPWTGALYVAATFNYKSITFQPGVRFDMYDPNAKVSPLVRPTIADVVAALDTMPDASIKFQISPRIGVTYPVTDQSQFRVNFAAIFKRPDFNLMFDNAYGDTKRGNALFGNPDIDPQKTFSYELGYETQVAEHYHLDVAAYYRDIFNQTGISFVPILPSPYTIYTVQEYGNVRGLQISARRELVDNISFDLNYTLQQARGTASSPESNYAIITAGIDPFTGETQKFPLQEFPLSYDQTHSLNGTVSLVWGEEQGPSLGSIKPLENTVITVTATYGTGLPYTRENTKGEQISEFNALRLPAVFDTEAHIERGFKLKDLFGEAVGNLELSLFADVFNLFNSTGATSVRFSRTGAGTRFSITASPDNDGSAMDRQLGDFTATPFYRDIDPARAETFSASQYDRYGQRYYNPYADSNLDGVVTQLEKYEGYQRFVSTIQALRAAYQFPRQVSVGVKIRF